MVFRTIFRSSENRPRINTALEVIVSITLRIFWLFSGRVDEFSDLNVVNGDSHLIIRGYDDILLFCLIIELLCPIQTRHIRHFW